MKRVKLNLLTLNTLHKREKIYSTIGGNINPNASRRNDKSSNIKYFYNISIKFFLVSLFIVFLEITSWGQIVQFPQVYYNGQGAGGTNLNIRSTPSLTSGTVLTSLSTTSRIGAETAVTSNEANGQATWIKVCLPSTTGSITYGYMLYGEYYARIYQVNNYATTTANLNIRTGAGPTFPNVTISGVNATFGNGSTISLTGTTSIIIGITWYQVFLTNNCSQATGYVSGAFLSIPSVQNYYIVAGTVQNASLVRIWGAAISFGSFGTNSTEGFYQFKLAPGWSGTISCTHPSYNTSTPASYSHTANSHNYTRHFVLSNCSAPSIPNNLAVTSVGTNSVSLSWSPVSGSGITYEVLKNTTSCGSTFGSSGLLTSGTTGTVTGLPSNTPHFFVVIARNSCGPSGYSNCVTATTSSVAPPIADFFTSNGTIVTGQSVTIFNTSSNATSYNWVIQRQEWNGSTPTVYTSSSTNISFNFPQTACYRVSLTATNAAGSNTLTRLCYIYATPNLSAPIPPDVTRAQKYYTYKGGDPVNLANGTFSFSMRDFSIPDVKTVLQLERRYFSNSGYDGPFGLGWHHSFDIKVNFSNNDDWFVQYPDGHNEHYAPYINGETRTLYPGNFDTLSYTSSGGVPTGFTLQQKDGTRWEFNGQGQILYIFDLDNNQITFSYSGGKLITITGPGGRYLLFTYNASNRVSTAKDNSNRTVYYYYDPANQYLDSTRIGNSTTSFQYGPQGMTEVHDPNGNRIVQNLYNAQSQVYEQYDADNKKTSFQYNTPVTGATTVTDPLLKSRVIKHDAKSRCIEVVNELNQVTKYGYSGNNTLDTITDARNFQTVFIHDAKGNQVKSTNAKGFSDSAAYTTLNKPAYIKDKEGNISKVQYSTTGNPTHFVLATGDTLKRLYENRGLDTLVIDAKGNLTRKNYNIYGDLIQTITPTSVTSIAYDAVGRPVEITDSYGRKDSLFWNNFDQIIKKKDKLGRIEEFGFDANGNQVSYKDKRGGITTTIYNKHDKPLRITEPQNHITEIEYDDNQRQKKVRSPNRQTLIYNYDDAGRELLVADSILGVLSQRTYDPSGNLATFSDALNKTWTNRIDEINRVASTINPLGDSVQYKYNKNNQPTEFIDEDGKSTKWEYDFLGRHIKTIDARNNFIQRFLNKNGLQDSVRDARGNIRNKATYDGSDRMLTLNDGFGNYVTAWDSSGNIKTITDPDNRSLSHFYNENNELTDITTGPTTLRHYVLDQNGDFLTANATVQTASVIRNQLGWITHYTNTFSNTIQHIYDSSGNVTRIIYPGGKQVDYKYNSLNKCTEVKDWTDAIYIIVRNNNGAVISIQHPNSFRTEVSRDDVARVSSWVNRTNTSSILQSNLLRRSKSGDILRDSGLHLLTFTPSIQISNGTYGKDDRLQTYGNAICTTNASGQRRFLNAPGRSYFYNWSFMGELTSTNHTGPTQFMQYDAFNERVTKRTSPTDSTRYIVDHNLASFPVVLQERNGADQELVNYIFIPGEGILLAKDSAGTFRYYHHDVKGNTIALSDTGGLITDRYEYTEFGDSIYHTGPSPQPCTWMGMYGIQQEGNGLYYLHARYYDGKTGTFISKDLYPVNYLSTQDINRYIYGYNNPLKFIDPTGLVAQNNISYENNNNWVRDGFIDALQKIAAGRWVGTGYAKDAYDYYEQGYIQSVLKGKPNNWYLVGLSAASLWTPENYRTTLGALTLKSNFSGVEATKFLGKTGTLNLIDMRTSLGRTIKELVGVKNAYDVIKRSYIGIYEKKEIFNW